MVKLDPTQSAASVYPKLFVGSSASDPLKKKKTKVRKGKGFKKEIKKQRKLKKEKRILSSRIRNENILIKSLKDIYPGMKNVEELAKNVNVVEDVNGSIAVNKEKINSIIDKLLNKDENVLSGIDKIKNKKHKTNDKIKGGKKSKNSEDKLVRRKMNGDSEPKSPILSKDKYKKVTEKSANINGSLKLHTSSNEITLVKKETLKVLNKKIKKSTHFTSQNDVELSLKVSEVSSSTKGFEDFQWMLGELSVDSFFEKHWEKSPLYVSRRNQTYYKSLVTSELIDQVLRDNFIEYTKNIDITSYVDGKRETHNPEGRALPHVVWDYYENGCSVRFLNPQSYIVPLQAMNASLQELFGCFVGANIYLTPCNSQGFAPHYDDIEAFILQLEGRKYWKVYAPRIAQEELPRFSSRNFSQDEIGEPILEVVLEAGDLLYIPRGFIHQASTVNSEHSLHVTISVYQKTAWIDLLEKILPKALETAAIKNVEFRKGLPIGYLNHAGFIKGKQKTERKQMRETLKSLVGKLVDYVDLDEGVDDMAKKFIHDALPPILSQDELKRTVFENGMKMIGTKVINQVDLNLETEVRLVRGNVCRLTLEQNEENQIEHRIYYTLDNSLEYQGKDVQFLIIPEEVQNVAVKLFKTYPKYIKMSDLVSSESKDAKDICIRVIKDLWEHGILMTSQPLSA